MSRPNKYQTIALRYRSMPGTSDERMAALAAEYDCTPADISTLLIREGVVPVESLRSRRRPGARQEAT